MYFSDVVCNALNENDIVSLETCLVSGKWTFRSESLIYISDKLSPVCVWQDVPYTI